MVNPDYTCLFIPMTDMTELEWDVALALARVMGRRAAVEESKLVLTQAMWSSLDTEGYRWLICLLMDGGETLDFGETNIPLDGRYQTCVESYLDTWNWLLEQSWMKVFRQPLVMA